MSQNFAWVLCDNRELKLLRLVVFSDTIFKLSFKEITKLQNLKRTDVDISCY